MLAVRVQENLRALLGVRCTSEHFNTPAMPSHILLRKQSLVIMPASVHGGRYLDPISGAAIARL